MAKKQGKYAAVLGNLPALGIDPARRDAVTQAQEQIKAPPHPDDLLTLDASAIIKQMSKLVFVLIESKKRQTAGKPYAAEYARAYAECRAIRDTIAEWDGAFSLLVEAYQWLMIPAMEAEGMKALTLDNGQPIRIREEPVAKIEDQAALMAWVKADPDLSNKLTLYYATVNTLTKERLLAGESEPPGVSVWIKTVVTLGGGE